MAEDELDELYWVKPQDFTAVRSRLAAAAKERGDGAGARQIAASRKPTTAAWAVNRLALSRSKAKQRLVELGQRLRAAHAAMDGDQIRELSAEQRKLIDELSRAAFDAAEMTEPSAVLREDVSGTLQAAIADPDVAARLGRLAKAERWSGFGDFGVTAPVSAATRGATTKAAPRGATTKAATRGATTKAAPEPARHEPAPAESGDDNKAARQQFERARAALAEAERAKSAADAELSERHTELVAARWRHQEARKRLDEAERELHAAEEAQDHAKRAGRDAAELVNEAKAQLKQART